MQKGDVVSYNSTPSDTSRGIVLKINRVPVLVNDTKQYCREVLVPKENIFYTSTNGDAI